MFRLLTLVSLLVLAGLTIRAQTAAAAHPIEDCPDAGCCWDKPLNERKNMTTPPAEQPQPTTVRLDEIKRYNYPARWVVGQSRQELKELGEGRHVRVEAYLINAAWGDLNPASCNRPGPENINIRLTLVSKDALALKRPFWPQTSVTAEVTPRVRALNRQWKQNLDNLLYSGDRNRLLVRVTGLMLLDTGRAFSPLNRATDWEIHPVLDIEVCRRGDCSDGVGWEKLEDARVPRLAPPHKPRQRRRRGTVIKP